MIYNRSVNLYIDTLCIRHQTNYCIWCMTTCVGYISLHVVHKLACGGLFVPRCFYNFIFMKELLEFLRNERLNKHLKQAYIAERLGVDESTISRWESGQITMDFLQIVNYATVLEIDVYEMFAYLASNGQDLPRPIAEVHVEVYTKEAYNSLMQYLANSGMDITIKSTKLKRWK